MRDGARRCGARATAVLLTAVVAAACTMPASQPDPAPTAVASPTAPDVAPPGEDVGGATVTVIVPPQSVVAEAEGSALVRAAAAMRAEPPDGVADVLVVEAETEAFARDLADLAVDDGRDLVCIVGVGSAPLALELARARRDGRFCTTDPRIEGGPVNLVAVGLDPVALVEAGAIALGGGPAPVGLLVVEQLGDVQAIATSFTTFVAAPAPPSPAPTSQPTAPTSPTPGTGDEPYAIVTAGSGAAAQLDAAEELAGQRPSRALVLATPGGHGATVALAASGALLVAVSDWAVDAEGELPAGLLVALTVDWDMLLRGAIAAALDPEAEQVQRRGIGSGALGALPGTAADAEAAVARTRDHLARAVTAAEGGG